MKNPIRKQMRNNFSHSASLMIIITMKICSHNSKECTAIWLKQCYFSMVSKKAPKLIMSSDETNSYVKAT